MFPYNLPGFGTKGAFRLDKKFSIELKGALPRRVRRYRWGAGEIPVIIEKVTKLEKLGLISRVRAEFASPAFLAKKKGV